MAENKDDGERYKILVVDDNQNVLNLLQITLEGAKKFDSDIQVAENAEEALELFEDDIFDLVLTDQKMPGMSGIELLTEVKNKHPFTRKILITGYSELDLAKQAINKADVDNYLEKPWDNTELRDTVYETLKAREEEPTVSEEGETTLEAGNTYLFEDKGPDRAIVHTLSKIEEGMDGLIISRKKKEKLSSMYEEYGLEEDGIKHYWLTRMAGDGNLDPAQLEEIADIIIRFFEEKDDSIVLLEGIESLMRDNTFERVIGFIENLVDVASMENRILVIFMDPETISGQQHAHIERNMLAI